MQIRRKTGRGRALRWQSTVRWVLHLVVWTPIAYGAVGGVAGGWTPTGDNAVIAVRAWGVLTSHGTLVGQPTFISHVFDLGPLEYWLIAIPVHMDPRYGPLLGASLMCMLAASLAVEAAWSAFGLWGASAAAAVVTADVAWMPVLSYQSIWNPHFGEFWFLATIASGLAVLMGNARWFAALVIAASVATQSHLMFAVPSITLVVLAALLIAVEAHRRRTSWQWLVAGAVVGLACWAAPFTQQLTSSTGNMAALLRSQAGSARTGLGYGLRAVGLALDPRTLRPGGGHDLTAALIGRSSAGAGILVIVCALLVAALALALRSRALGVVAIVNLLLLLSLAAVYADSPKGDVKVATYYLVEPTFPVGVFALLTGATAVVLAGQWILVRARRAGRFGRATAAAAERGPSRLQQRLLSGACGVVVLAAMTFALANLSPAYGNPVLAQRQTAVPVACTAIERQLPPGPVRLQVAARNASQEQLLTFGITECLVPAGYSPELTPSLAAYLGPTFSARSGTPLVSVLVSRQRTAVVLHTASHPPG